MRVYDPVTKARELLDELIMARGYLEKVTEELNKMQEITEENFEQFEELYAKEFELAVKMCGIYEDIYRIVDKQMTDETKFQLRRIAQEADKNFKPLIVEIKL